MASPSPRHSSASATSGPPAPAGKVLVTWIDFQPDDPTTGGRLRNAGLEVCLAPKLGARDHQELVRLVGDAVAAIVSTDPFDRAVLAAAPLLRVIARVGVGTDSIDIRAATEAGIVVTTTPGANRETAADHAVAMILAAVRRIVEHDASVRRGEWLRAGGMTPWDLHGTTVGLIGFGDIGRAVAKRLRGFGTRMLIADPAHTAETAGDGHHVVALDTLLAEADIVSLHLPLRGSTRGIIGARELAAMRTDALLVNTARGGLVDEEALVDALDAGSIRGAALDVFAEEPDVPMSLRDRPNVVLTPHVGGLSERSIARMTRAATDSVLSVLAGTAAAHSVLNPRALDHPRHRAAAAPSLALPGAS